MYKKQLRVETAGMAEIGGAFVPGIGGAGGAVADRPDKPVEAAIGGGVGSLAGAAVGAPVGTAAGTAAGGLLGMLGGPLAPVTAPIGAALGSGLGTTIGAGLGAGIGAGAGKDILAGQKKGQMAGADEFEAPDPIESFLNKHTSTAEAVQEKEVLPSVNENKGKFVASTACSGKV